MREPLGMILAGGRGTRMGGVSKAELTLGGQSLLARCIGRLDPQVGALAVNANHPLPTTLPVLPDTRAGHLGPLAGVLAGLLWARNHSASHLVTVACDTPFFPCDLVPHLLMAAEGHPSGLAIAATSDGPHGTFGLWSVALIDALTAFLDRGGRKVTAFTGAQQAATATFPDTDPPAFFNINTPGDLARAEAWL